MIARKRRGIVSLPGGKIPLTALSGGERSANGDRALRASLAGDEREGNARASKATKARMENSLAGVAGPATARPKAR